MDDIKSYESAVNCIGGFVAKILGNIPYMVKKDTYEIRLRSERPVSLCGKYGTRFIAKNGTLCKTTDSVVYISHEELRDIFNRICAFSVYTFQKSINSGYIPMENGNRAGVCGTAVCEKGIIHSVRDITSINIRISHEIKGCADKLLEETDDNYGSYIVAGSPSSGKTTMIRDVIRQLSSGATGEYYKVAVIDERRELSGIANGRITNDLGLTSDILDSYPKSEAIDIAIRTFSPDVIVCDEISTTEEINAVKSGLNCGVRFFLTVHAGREEELYSRRQIEELLSTHSFEKIFLLDTGASIGKIKKIYCAEELFNEISLRRIGCGGIDCDRLCEG